MSECSLTYYSLLCGLSSIFSRGKMGCVEGVKEEPGRVQRRGSLRGTWGVKEGVCGIGDTGVYRLREVASSSCKERSAEEHECCHDDRGNN